MIKVTTYGGKPGWFLRKYFSCLTSAVWLRMQYFLRRKRTIQYISMCQQEQPQPMLVSIETINRCNGNCSFCPASVGNETRPIKKMPDELFAKVINELADWKYSGYIMLCVNNEPFMDKQIIKRYQYVKEKLPLARTLMFTNGTMLDIGKFVSILPFIDLMFINNYTKQFRLHDNIKGIVDYAEKNPDILKGKNVTVQIRYAGEILTNRNGSAPNKPRKSRPIKEPCLLPFTDITIYPSGVCGLCCSDVKEITNIADCNTAAIYDIWDSLQYRQLRKKMLFNRSHIDFCDGCDFIDAGIRHVEVNKQINGANK